MEPNQQQNTRLSSVQNDIKAYLKAQVQADIRTSEWRSQDYIGLNQSSGNARQVAANLKIKMDNLELLYEHME